MKVDLSPQDRREIIDALEWRQHEKCEYDLSGLDDAEAAEVIEESQKIKEHYNILINLIQYGRKPK